ncbi:MAG: hypothetical protein A4E53_02502 [Pelotomaculum sp. PtaB.Bin104]|nr:MAG: hypothetical protein A4E53_02502 [Pelotomaculum sp. PtaB.Bin104]
MKRGRRIMYWALGIFIFLFLGIFTWFSIPYSPVKSEFEQLKSSQNSGLHAQNQVFTKEDIADLPLPLQRYFDNCGFIGQPKMSNMKILHNDVDFILSSSMPKLKIKYIQYNSVEKPERVALIDTHLYSIPFEGIDSYQNGIGSMKGVIAKSVTLFNQKGEALNQSSLVNCLAESLLMPNFALQDFMSWEAIDANHAKGTISYYGISASGVFSFDKNGLLESFTTDDRLYVDTKGNQKQVKWSAICGDYRDINGIKQPKSLQAVWHLPEGDLVYFDGHDTVVQYDVAE